jgi:hypothetical protein
MRKRAGRKEYKEKDREDGGRMVKRRWRGGSHIFTMIKTSLATPF